jgi:hypothetical protein
LYVYIRIFLSSSNINIANNRRAFLYAAFLQYMIQGVGSAILSSSAGMIGFAAIALFTNVADITDEKKKLPRIKIRL